MTPLKIDPDALSDSDASTICTPTTTTTGTFPPYDKQDPISIPSPYIPTHNSTVKIRCVTSKRLITLLDGHVVLVPEGGRGSVHWECVESKGWLGFRNHVSGKFLGHDKVGRLMCSVEHHDGWERFTITPTLWGGYILQMSDWSTLRPVMLNEENGLRKLGRTGEKLADGIVWEFIKVD